MSDLELESDVAVLRRVKRLAGELVGELLEPILESLNRIEGSTVATQAEVDQLVQELGTIHADLDTAKTNIEAQFSTLEAELAGSGVSLDPLKSAVEGLTPPAEALVNLKANPPAPAPAAAAPGGAPAAADAGAGASSASSPSAIDQAAAQQAGG